VRESLQTRIRNLRRHFREEEVSTTGQKALHDVQTQIDNLIEQLMSAKIMLASLSIGADEVSVDWERYTPRPE
jgi:ribosomal protein S15P/S13E